MVWWWTCPCWVGLGDQRDLFQLHWFCGSAGIHYLLTAKKWVTVLVKFPSNVENGTQIFPEVTVLLLKETEFLKISYHGMNLHCHHITDATWTSESSPRLWKHMHCPTFTAFPKATNFGISFTLRILQTTTHTSLFWLIKVRTYSAIPDWGNLSSGLRLQFKTFSEHKNTAIFYWTRFPAIYANIYIAPWVAVFLLF